MSEVPNEQNASHFAAFQHKAYARYFLARFLSSFAIQIVSTVVGWQMWDETRNAFWLGLIGLVQFLPAVLLVLVTGLASDKLGRRLMMGSSLILEMLCVVIIFWHCARVLHPCLDVTGCQFSA